MLQDLPIVIEIVDSREKIEAFFPELDEMITDGLYSGTGTGCSIQLLRLGNCF